MLLRDNFNSFNFYKNGELSRNQIGWSGEQVKKENEKFTVVRSRSPQNLKCGHFTLLFCRGRQRNVPKWKNARAERLFLLIKPMFLRCCRCRCRRRCLSSLMFTLSRGPSNIVLYLKFWKQICRLALIEWLAWIATSKSLATFFKFNSMSKNNRS